MIDSFRNLPSHPRVIMLLPAAVFTKNANSIYDSVIVNSIIPMCRNVAYNKKCEVIDLHPMFLGKENLLPDGIHPNAAGQQLIAERLYEQLQLSEFKPDLFSKIKEPLTVSNFYGFDCADFKFENRECKIVKPRTAGKGRPWIWRARFWGHEPQTDIALLERGFYVVYCDVAELYGNKQAIEIWNGFYSKMRKLGLNKKAANFDHSNPFNNLKTKIPKIKQNKVNPEPVIKNSANQPSKKNHLNSTNHSKNLLNVNKALKPNKSRPNLKYNNSNLTNQKSSQNIKIVSKPLGIKKIPLPYNNSKKNVPIPFSNKQKNALKRGKKIDNRNVFERLYQVPSRRIVLNEASVNSRNEYKDKKLGTKRKVGKKVNHMDVVSVIKGEKAGVVDKVKILI